MKALDSAYRKQNFGSSDSDSSQFEDHNEILIPDEKSIKPQQTENIEILIQSYENCDIKGGRVKAMDELEIVYGRLINRYVTLEKAFMSMIEDDEVITKLSHHGFLQFIADQNGCPVEAAEEIFMLLDIDKDNFLTAEEFYLIEDLLQHRRRLRIIRESILERFVSLQHLLMKLPQHIHHPGMQINPILSDFPITLLEGALDTILQSNRHQKFTHQYDLFSIIKNVLFSTGDGESLSPAPLDTVPCISLKHFLRAVATVRPHIAHSLPNSILAGFVLYRLKFSQEDISMKKVIRMDLERISGRNSTQYSNSPPTNFSLPSSPSRRASPSITTTNAFSLEDIRLLLNDWGFTETDKILSLLSRDGIRSPSPMASLLDLILHSEVSSIQSFIHDISQQRSVADSMRKHVLSLPSESIWDYFHSRFLPDVLQQVNHFVIIENTQKKPFTKSEVEWLKKEKLQQLLQETKMNIGSYISEMIRVKTATFEEILYFLLMQSHYFLELENQGSSLETLLYNLLSSSIQEDIDTYRGLANRKEGKDDQGIVAVADMQYSAEGKERVAHYVTENLDGEKIKYCTRVAHQIANMVYDAFHELGTETSAVQLEEVNRWGVRHQFCQLSRNFSPDEWREANKILFVHSRLSDLLHNFSLQSPQLGSLVTAPLFRTAVSSMISGHKKDDEKDLSPRSLINEQREAFYEDLRVFYNVFNKEQDGMIHAKTLCLYVVYFLESELIRKHNEMKNGIAEQNGSRLPAVRGIDWKEAHVLANLRDRLYQRYGSVTESIAAIFGEGKKFHLDDFNMLISKEQVSGWSYDVAAIVFEAINVDEESSVDPRGLLTLFRFLSLVKGDVELFERANININRYLPMDSTKIESLEFLFYLESQEADRDRRRNSTETETREWYEYKARRMMDASPRKRISPVLYDEEYTLHDLRKILASILPNEGDVMRLFLAGDSLFEGSITFLQVFSQLRLPVSTKNLLELGNLRTFSVLRDFLHEIYRRHESIDAAWLLLTSSMPTAASPLRNEVPNKAESPLRTVKYVQGDHEYNSAKYSPGYMSPKKVLEKRMMERGEYLLGDCNPHQQPYLCTYLAFEKAMRAVGIEGVLVKNLFSAFDVHKDGSVDLLELMNAMRSIESGELLSAVASINSPHVTKRITGLASLTYENSEMLLDACFRDGDRENKIESLRKFRQFCLLNYSSFSEALQPFYRLVNMSTPISLVDFVFLCQRAYNYIDNAKVITDNTMSHIFEFVDRDGRGWIYPQQLAISLGIVANSSEKFILLLWVRYRLINTYGSIRSAFQFMIKLQQELQQSAREEDRCSMLTFRSICGVLGMVDPHKNSGAKIYDYGLVDSIFQLLDFDNDGFVSLNDIQTGLLVDTKSLEAMGFVRDVILTHYETVEAFFHSIGDVFDDESIIQGRRVAKSTIVESLFVLLQGKTKADKQQENFQTLSYTMPSNKMEEDPRPILRTLETMRSQGASDEKYHLERQLSNGNLSAVLSTFLPTNYPQEGFSENDKEAQRQLESDLLEALSLLMDRIDVDGDGLLCPGEVRRCFYQYALETRVLSPESVHDSDTAEICKRLRNAYSSISNAIKSIVRRDEPLSNKRKVVTTNPLGESYSSEPGKSSSFIGSIKERKRRASSNELDIPFEISPEQIDKRNIQIEMDTFEKNPNALEYLISPATLLNKENFIRYVSQLRIGTSQAEKLFSDIDSNDEGIVTLFELRTLLRHAASTTAQSVLNAPDTPRSTIGTTCELFVNPVAFGVSELSSPLRNELMFSKAASEDNFDALLHELRAGANNTYSEYGIIKNFIDSENPFGVFSLPPDNVLREIDTAIRTKFPNRRAAIESLSFSVWKPLTFPEFISVLMENFNVSFSIAQAAFEIIDTDSNGLLTLDEFRRALRRFASKEHAHISNQREDSPAEHKLPNNLSPDSANILLLLYDILQSINAVVARLCNANIRPGYKESSDATGMQSDSVGGKKYLMGVEMRDIDENEFEQALNIIVAELRTIGKTREASVIAYGDAIKKLFTELDTTGDGLISPLEVRTALVQLLQWRDDERKRLSKLNARIISKSTYLYSDIFQQKLLPTSISVDSLPIYSLSFRLLSKGVDYSERLENYMLMEGRNRIFSVMKQDELLLQLGKITSADVTTKSGVRTVGEGFLIYRILARLNQLESYDEESLSISSALYLENDASNNLLQADSHTSGQKPSALSPVSPLMGEIREGARLFDLLQLLTAVNASSLQGLYSSISSKNQNGIIKWRHAGIFDTSTHYLTRASFLKACSLMGCPPTLLYVASCIFTLGIVHYIVPLANVRGVRGTLQLHQGPLQLTAQQLGDILQARTRCQIIYSLWLLSLEGLSFKSEPRANSSTIKVGGQKIEDEFEFQYILKQEALLKDNNALPMLHLRALYEHVCCSDVIWSQDEALGGVTAHNLMQKLSEVLRSTFLPLSLMAIQSYYCNHTLYTELYILLLEDVFDILRKHGDGKSNNNNVLAEDMFRLLEVCLSSPEGRPFAVLTSASTYINFRVQNNVIPNIDSVATGMAHEFCTYVLSSIRSDDFNSIHVEEYDNSSSAAIQNKQSNAMRKTLNNTIALRDTSVSYVNMTVDWISLRDSVSLVGVLLRNACVTLRLILFSFHVDSWRDGSSLVQDVADTIAKLKAAKSESSHEDITKKILLPIFEEDDLVTTSLFFDALNNLGYNLTKQIFDSLVKYLGVTDSMLSLECLKGVLYSLIVISTKFYLWNLDKLNDNGEVVQEQKKAKGKVMALSKDEAERKKQIQRQNDTARMYRSAIFKFLERLRNRSAVLSNSRMIRQWVAVLGTRAATLKDALDAFDNAKTPLQWKKRSVTQKVNEFPEILPLNTLYSVLHNVNIIQSRFRTNVVDVQQLLIMQLCSQVEQSLQNQQIANSLKGQILLTALREYFHPVHDYVKRFARYCLDFKVSWTLVSTKLRQNSSSLLSLLEADISAPINFDETDTIMRKMETDYMQSSKVITASNLKSFFDSFPEFNKPLTNKMIESKEEPSKKESEGSISVGEMTDEESSSEEDNVPEVLNDAATEILMEEIIRETLLRRFAICPSDTILTLTQEQMNALCFPLEIPVQRFFEEGEMEKNITSADPSTTLEIKKKIPFFVPIKFLEQLLFTECVNLLFEGYIRQKTEKLFEILDTNGNECIEASELKATVSLLTPFSPLGEVRNMQEFLLAQKYPELTKNEFSAQFFNGVRYMLQMDQSNFQSVVNHYFEFIYQNRSSNLPIAQDVSSLEARTSEGEDAYSSPEKRFESFLRAAKFTDKDVSSPECAQLFHYLIQKLRQGDRRVQQQRTGLSFEFLRLFLSYFDEEVVDNVLENPLGSIAATINSPLSPRLSSSPRVGSSGRISDSNFVTLRGLLDENKFYSQPIQMLMTLPASNELLTDVTQANTSSLSYEGVFLRRKIFHSKDFNMHNYLSLLSTLNGDARIPSGWSSTAKSATDTPSLTSLLQFFWKRSKNTMFLDKHFMQLVYPTTVPRVRTSMTRSWRCFSCRPTCKSFTRSSRREVHYGDPNVSNMHSTFSLSLVVAHKEPLSELPAEKECVFAVRTYLWSNVSNFHRTNIFTQTASVKTDDSKQIWSFPFSEELIVRADAANEEGIDTSLYLVVELILVAPLQQKITSYSRSPETSPRQIEHNGHKAVGENIIPPGMPSSGAEGEGVLPLPLPLPSADRENVMPPSLPMSKMELGESLMGEDDTKKQYLPVVLANVRISLMDVLTDTGRSVSRTLTLLKGPIGGEGVRDTSTALRKTDFLTITITPIQKCSPRVRALSRHLPGLCIMDSNSLSLFKHFTLHCANWHRSGEYERTLPFATCLTDRKRAEASLRERFEMSKPDALVKSDEAFLKAFTLLEDVSSKDEDFARGEDNGKKRRKPEATPLPMIELNPGEKDWRKAFKRNFSTNVLFLHFPHVFNSPQLLYALQIAFNEIFMRLSPNQRNDESVLNDVMHSLVVRSWIYSSRSRFPRNGESLAAHGALLGAQHIFDEDGVDFAAAQVKGKDVLGGNTQNTNTGRRQWFFRRRKERAGDVNDISAKTVATLRKDKIVSVSVLKYFTSEAKNDVMAIHSPYTTWRPLQWSELIPTKNNMALHVSMAAKARK